MLFMTVCVVGSVNALPAQAGLKEVVRDTSTVLEEINESVWHNVVNTLIDHLLESDVID